jgi:phage tail-like protein
MTNNKLLQYLPEFYQEKGPGKEFLERFLSIFAAIINNIDETISAIPTNFDPLTAPDDFIPWLAQWLSLDLYELLGEKNREFILRAFEFYKQKGTVPGIEKLVTLLTGKKCLVKEFTHNVFRSQGMESSDKNGVLVGNTGFSKTVDTSNPVLLSKMGTHDDEVNYVNDSGETGLYNRNVIGLYIFLLKTESEFIIKEDQLHKIIDSFLPVFVRAEIFIIEENYETYEIDNIMDAFKGRAHGFLKEEFPGITGVYSDAVNWKFFYTNKGFSNDMQSRTMHDELGEEKSIE